VKVVVVLQVATSGQGLITLMAHLIQEAVVEASIVSPSVVVEKEALVS